MDRPINDAVIKENNDPLRAISKESQKIKEREAERDKYANYQRRLERSNRAPRGQVGCSLYGIIYFYILSQIPLIATGIRVSPHR